MNELAHSMTGRGVIERVGLVTIAFGVFMATALAWVLTKVPWSWANESGLEVGPVGVGGRLGSTADIAYSLGHSYSWERHVAAEWALHIGIVFAVLGVVLVLVGKAVTGRGADSG